MAVPGHTFLSSASAVEVTNVYHGKRHESRRLLISEGGSTKLHLQAVLRSTKIYVWENLFGRLPNSCMPGYRDSVFNNTITSILQKKWSCTF